MIKRIIFVLLYPLSLLYGLAVRVRNALFDLGWLRSESFAIPVISVGNITVGGTGKTPHIEYLIRILSPLCQVAVLSRGYGRRTHGFLMVEECSRAVDAGDEPCQIKKKFPEVLVAVDEQRVHGVKQLLALSARPDVILLDDAFQHRYIQPGLSILLVDYNRPMYQDTILPAGSMREPFAGKSRADIMVITKSPVEVSEAEKRSILAKYSPEVHQRTYFSILEYSQPVPLFPGEAGRVDSSGEISVLLVTGIARPEPLKEWLELSYKQVVSLVFPDHHIFTDGEISGIDRVFHCIDGLKIIMTTEKDAVRLRDMLPSGLRPFVYVAPIHVSFLPQEDISFDDSVHSFLSRITMHHKFS